MFFTPSLLGLTLIFLGRENLVRRSLTDPLAVCNDGSRAAFYDRSQSNVSDIYQIFPTAHLSPDFCLFHFQVNLIFLNRTQNYVLQQRPGRLKEGAHLLEGGRSVLQFWARRRKELSPKVQSDGLNFKFWLHCGNVKRLGLRSIFRCGVNIDGELCTARTEETLELDTDTMWSTDPQQNPPFHDFARVFSFDHIALQMIFTKLFSCKYINNTESITIAILMTDITNSGVCALLLKWPLHWHKGRLCWQGLLLPWQIHCQG